MELLVAAVLVLIAIVAVVAAVRKTTEMQVSDNCRRQARAIITKHFERSFVHIAKNGPPPFYSAKEGDIYLNVIVDNPAPQVHTALLFINRAQTGSTSLDMIPCILSFHAKSSTKSVVINSITQNIYVHDIEAKVQWTDVDGTIENVVLTKRLADIHDL